MSVSRPGAVPSVLRPGGLGHFGWPGAFGTWWQADPANDVIVLYLIQTIRI
jgi:CubicO group peptidase (beta-lactamase class C family)